VYAVPSCSPVVDFSDSVVVVKSVGVEMRKVGPRYRPDLPLAAQRIKSMIEAVHDRESMIVEADEDGKMPSDKKSSKPSLPLVCVLCGKSGAVAYDRVPPSISLPKPPASSSSSTLPAAHSTAPSAAQAADQWPFQCCFCLLSFHTACSSTLSSVASRSTSTADDAVNAHPTSRQPPWLAPNNKHSTVHSFSSARFSSVTSNNKVCRLCCVQLHLA
jgi:hypothetical protein